MSEAAERIAWQAKAPALADQLKAKLGDAFGGLWIDCGTVTAIGVTATYNGVTVQHLGRSNVCGVPGDSGAPMYASNTAYGLLVAGFSLCDTLYQGIGAAEDALNVNLAHTAG